MANMTSVPINHSITVRIQSDIYDRLKAWAKAEKQPVEIIIAEILRANVGLA